MRPNDRTRDPDAEGAVQSKQHGLKTGRLDGYPIEIPILTGLRVYGACSRYFGQTLVCDTDEQHWLGASDLI
jgi:hypothetical protein